MLFGLLLVGAIASCKKDNKNDCPANVDSIAGNYKITKVQGDYPSPLPSQDLTDETLDACQKSGVFALKSDRTFTYAETGTGCTSTGAGTWDIVDTKITLDFTTGSGSFIFDFSATPITSYDCSTFIVSEDQGNGISIKYSFTKQ